MARNKLVFQARDGDDLVIVGDFAGQQIGHFERDADAGKIDRRRVEDAAHGNGHVLLA